MQECSRPYLSNFFYVLSSSVKGFNFKLVKGPCITEDTAFCFVALNGLPGSYIKHFMSEIGHEA